MLYLHCGWPKTGTTTLQAALAENRDVLAEAKVIYPERWTRAGDNCHRLFANKGGPEAAIEEVEGFLETHSDHDVLISSELLSLRLLNGEFKGQLASLIATARQVMPVRCIWTLRRFDELVRSICLHRAKFGYAPSTVNPLEDFDVNSLFAGMRAMSDAGGETIYVKYASDGHYEPDMRRVLDLPASVAGSFDLTTMPRKNVGLTHKQVTVMLNLETLSRRCGVVLEAQRLREVFANGDFRFVEDRPCDLLDAAVRRDLHAAALMAAQEWGISAYGRFFGDTEIGPPPTQPSGDPDSISSADLDRLVAELRQASPA